MKKLRIPRYDPFKGKSDSQREDEERRDREERESLQEFKTKLRAQFELNRSIKEDRERDSDDERPQSQLDSIQEQLNSIKNQLNRPTGQNNGPGYRIYPFDVMPRNRNRFVDCTLSNGKSIWDY